MEILLITVIEKEPHLVTLVGKFVLIQKITADKYAKLSIYDDSPPGKTRKF